MEASLRKGSPTFNIEICTTSCSYERRIFFFRGIAGENASYVGSLGVDAVVTGYCSQEKHHTGEQ